MTDKERRIVRAAERLVRHWKKREPSDWGETFNWGHRAHWYPIGSEKEAKALINAVLAASKRSDR